MDIWEEAPYQQRGLPKDWYPVAANGVVPLVDGQTILKNGRVATSQLYVQHQQTEKNGEDSATTFIDVSFLQIYI